MQQTPDILRTERLLLQPFKATDADEVFGAITPTLTRFMAFEPPDSMAAFRAIGQGWLGAMEARSEYTFVIRHRQRGTFIGIAALHDAAEPEPELGIWISEHEHGNGYGREAVRAVVDWAANRFSASSFRYPVAEENLPSRQLAERLGGQVVATEAAPKFASVVYRVPARLPSQD